MLATLRQRSQCATPCNVAGRRARRATGVPWRQVERYCLLPAVASGTLLYFGLDRPAAAAEALFDFGRTYAGAPCDRSPRA